jgi:hypothetical protein
MYRSESGLPKKINPPKGILAEIERLDDKPRADWYARQMRLRNLERMENKD